MDQNMGDWEQKNLVNELTRGKELARQLQIHLNAANTAASASSSSSSHETREYLVQNILRSYEKALSMLNWTSLPAGDHPLQPSPGAPVRMSESPPSLTGSPRSEDSDRDQDNKDNIGSRKRKSLPRWTQQVRVDPGMGLEGPLDDGFSWRKYGQKDILGAKYPRGYYRCTHRNVQGCLATKQVQRSDEDSTIFEITYRGRHTCTQASHVLGTASSGQNQELPTSNNSIINISNTIESHHPHPPNNLLQPLEQTQQQTQDHMLSDFKSGLKVITEGLDNLDGQSSLISSSFNLFASTSNLNIPKAEENPRQYFEPNSMINDGFVGGFSPSFVSPAASGTNYFSASQGGSHEFGVDHHQNFDQQGSESEIAEIISAVTSATGTPTIGPDFQFGHGEFDSNFTFDNSGLF
ncbi:WRKY domain containing protein [Parasponia andersonii]|uniref:WRKY domain containing protein n=1 Tax=Parasponia andersonii TaxID=3476 RepID=A0A2P5BMT0_PARAD|nr:WRKY domain containing protein [Parasponia andersonii]